VTSALGWPCLATSGRADETDEHRDEQVEVGAGAPRVGSAHILQDQPVEAADDQSRELVVRDGAGLAGVLGRHPAPVRDDIGIPLVSPVGQFCLAGRPQGVSSYWISCRPTSDSTSCPQTRVRVTPSLMKGRG